MLPRIEILPEKKLAGNSMQMSFAANKTIELWKNFMPKVKQLNLPASFPLYSLEVYNDAAFFNNFDPKRTFEKWAAIEADNLTSIPDDFKMLILPTGLYAIFIHRGPAADGYKTYEFIFKTWLPSSNYTLDNRPHFALMGSTYKNDDPDSEEEIWIPIKDRD